jgi:hypothetical protein
MLMSHAQHDDEYDPTAARRRLRRGKAAVGAVGLAAILGGGAFLVTDLLTDKPETATDSGALSPLDRPSAAPERESPTPKASATRHGRSGATAAKTANPALSSPMPSVSPSRGLHANGSKNRVPTKRPLVLPAKTLDPSAVTVTNSGSPQSGTTLRVISARGDLTGQREIAWVADDGKKVGDARCSQTIQLSPDVKPARKPTLMICWRTSATRSVVTVMVNLAGHPSAEGSVAALDKRWAALG